MYSKFILEQSIVVRPKIGYWAGLWSLCINTDVGCRTGTMFVHFQASRGEYEVTAQSVSHARQVECPNPLTNGSRSTLTSFFVLAFALTCKTQKNNACSAG